MSILASINPKQQIGKYLRQLGILTKDQHKTALDLEMSDIEKAIESARSLDDTQLTVQGIAAKKAILEFEKDKLPRLKQLRAEEQDNFGDNANKAKESDELEGELFRLLSTTELKIEKPKKFGDYAKQALKTANRSEDIVEDVAALQSLMRAREIATTKGEYDSLPITDAIKKLGKVFATTEVSKEAEITHKLTNLTSNLLYNSSETSKKLPEYKALVSARDNAIETSLSKVADSFKSHGITKANGNDLQREIKGLSKHQGADKSFFEVAEDANGVLKFFASIGNFVVKAFKSVFSAIGGFVSSITGNKSEEVKGTHTEKLILSAANLTLKRVETDKGRNETGGIKADEAQEVLQYLQSQANELKLGNTAKILGEKIASLNKAAGHSV